MRTLSIVVAGVLVVLAGLVLLAAFNLNGLLESNRGRLEQQAESALGRPVRFGELGVSLTGGLSVRVADLHVAEDPAFAEGDFLSAEAVHVGVRILPVLAGRLEIGRVVLNAPTIRVIRKREGLSTDSLGAASAGEGPGAGTPEPAAGSALRIALVDVRNGRLTYTDRTASPASELRVAALSFSASDIGRQEPVDFELGAAVLGAEKPNLSVSGSVGPLDAAEPRLDVKLSLDPLELEPALASGALAGALPEGLRGSGRVRVTAQIQGEATKLRFEARVDASEASVEVGESFVKAAGVPLLLTATGQRDGDAVVVEPLSLVSGNTRVNGRVALTDLAAPLVDFALEAPAIALGAQGGGGSGDELRTVVVQGKVRSAAQGPQGALRLRSEAGTLAGTPYENLVADVRLAGARVDLESLTLDAFDGSLEANGFQAQPDVGARAKLAGMQVEQISTGGLLTGRLDGELDLRGKGADWEAIQPSLVGDGGFRVRDGVIRDFNPAGSTLRAVMALPMISDRRLARLPSEHPRAFGMGDTAFQRLDGKLRVAGGAVQVRDLVLTTPDYSLLGAGTYGFDGRVDFQTSLVFSDEISAKFIEDQRAFRYLRTREGRVAIPVRVSGTSPHLTTQPDVSGLATAASREALGGAIDKALGVEEKETPPGEAPPPPTTKDIGRDVLRRGLDELLGGGQQPKR